MGCSYLYQARPSSQLPNGLRPGHLHQGELFGKMGHIPKITNMNQGMVSANRGRSRPPTRAVV